MAEETDTDTQFTVEPFILEAGHTSALFDPLSVEDEQTIANLLEASKSEIGRLAAEQYIIAKGIPPRYQPLDLGTATADAMLKRLNAMSLYYTKAELTAPFLAEGRILQRHALIALIGFLISREPSGPPAAKRQCIEQRVDDLYTQIDKMTALLEKIANDRIDGRASARASPAPSAASVPATQRRPPLTLTPPVNRPDGLLQQLQKLAAVPEEDETAAGTEVLCPYVSAFRAIYPPMAVPAPKPAHAGKCINLYPYAQGIAGLEAKGQISPPPSDVARYISEANRNKVVTHASVPALPAPSVAQIVSSMAILHSMMRKFDLDYSKDYGQVVCHFLVNYSLYPPALVANLDVNIRMQAASGHVEYLDPLSHEFSEAFKLLVNDPFQQIRLLERLQGPPRPLSTTAPAHRQSASAAPAASAAAKVQRRPDPGYCIKFNTGVCSFASCKYPHICSNPPCKAAGANHSFKSCAANPVRSQKPGASPALQQGRPAGPG